MSGRKTHIAKSGKNVGKFVPCQAERNCRVGGTHVDAAELKDIKRFAGRKSVTEVTVEDHIDYLKAKIAAPFVPATAPELNFLFVESDPEMTPDELDQADTIKHGTDGKGTMVAKVSFTHARWMEFLMTSTSYGVDIPFDTIKAGGQHFRAGHTVLEFEALPLRGDEARIREFLALFK